MSNEARTTLRFAAWLLAGGMLAASGAPAETTSADATMRGPVFIGVETGDAALLVLCERSGTLLRIDRQTGRHVTELDVGEAPFDLALHPDGRRCYVSCRRGQEVVELSLTEFAVLRRFPMLGDPTGLAVSADGARLYVGVHSLDQIAVFDLERGAAITRLAAGNGPEFVRLDAASGRVYVTNLLPNPAPAGEPCVNEITVIDDASARIVDRIMLENANIGRQIAFAPDGAYAVAAISRPKNLVPMVQVARGWVVTNGFAFIEPSRDAAPVQLLIDLPNQSYADPYAVAVTPDGRKFYVSSAGTDTVVAVELAALRRTVQDTKRSGMRLPADHLGLSRRYVTARIPVGENPLAMAMSGSGERLYVANRLDDTISVIDTTSDAVIETITIGAPSVGDRLLRGERLFNSAARTFQNQFTCASCHPDNGFDGLQYDLEPDGIGKNILDNRNMRGVDGTAPFKWVGTNPDIATQCGTRTAKWIVRTGWLNSTQVVALAEYIHSIPSVTNPYRRPEEPLTPFQRRGQALFERTELNDGTPIEPRDQCHFCHSGPRFTNARRFDVGTQAERDTKFEFDSAHLNNIFESDPYLHDGRATTLEEIWTVHNPDDRHGISSDWTKQQLNDLVEYLKVLGAAEETKP